MIYRYNGQIYDSTPNPYSKRYPFKSTATYTQLTQGDSSYRIQGGAIKDDYLFWTMTKGDTTSRLYKYNLLNNSIINYVDGSYGHAGDLTYNPEIDKLITLYGQTSSTTFYFLSPDDLSLQSTKTVVTQDERIGAIAFNPITKGYILQLSANGTWTNYHFAKADSNLNILETFLPIKNSYLLQGIECDGLYIYALYANPNIIIVYDMDLNYIGYHTVGFNTEPQFICKYNDTTFYVGQDGNKKVYQMTRDYEWIQ